MSKGVFLFLMATVLAEINKTLMAALRGYGLNGVLYCREGIKGSLLLNHLQIDNGHEGVR